MDCIETSTPLSQPTASAPLPSMREEARRLLALAAPIIGTMVSAMLLGFTDFVMVSWLGTEATAAISPGTMLLYSVLCLGMGCANSVQTFSAQALGRGRREEAAAYAWQPLYIALFFTLLTYPVSRLMPVLWEWVGHAPAVRAQEIAYTQVIIWCTPLAITCIGLEGFFNGLQRPKVALASVATAVLFNVAANYVLIFGKLGLPALGIAGAAYATLISWSIRLVMLATVFLSTEFRGEYRSGRSWRPDWGRLGGILRIGGPTGVQWSLDVSSWFVFLTCLIGTFGTVTLAASNAALQLMHVSFMAALGIGSAVNSLVGHAIGQGRHDLAVLRARVGLLLCGGYMSSVGLVFLLGRHHLIGLLCDDPEVMAIGAGILIWAAAFQMFDAVGITYVHALRGAGDTRWPAILVAICNWGVFIGGGFLVTYIWPSLGYHGPWMMCTLYIVLIGVALWRRFERGEWRKIELFKGGPSPAPAELIDVPSAVCDVEQVGAGA